MIFAEIFFWISVAALFHSYIFYPALVRLFSFRKKQNEIIYQADENLPFVTLVIPAYNEEQIIAQKIESIFKSDYPKDKIEVLIGSDTSTDKTNDIVRSYCNKFSQIHLEEFKTRSGKVGIINELTKKARYELIIFTDANVIFEKKTIYELIKHFKNDEIGLVDSNMINTGLRKEGISVQEKTYIQAEVGIKNAESKLWGTMMGPFGGCYGLRKKYFSEVPLNFLVDDFYLNMKVLEKGGKCINEINARVYEDVSNNLSEEFRRKVRIATGNFQNLFAFLHLLLRFNKVSFCLLSHKVLRWTGPLFIIIAFVSNLFLLQHTFYKLTFVSQMIFYLIPLVDFLFKQINIHLVVFRFITHLLAMNLALMIGLLKFSRGVNSGIWQPTQRNQ